MNRNSVCHNIVRPAGGMSSQYTVSSIRPDTGREVETGLLAFLLDQPRHLAAGRRFAGTLQAAKHDGRHVTPQVQRRCTNTA